MKLKVFLSDTYDPWFNLATEDYIFRDMDPSIPVLFLWRNENTVVIGRFQNPWAECNLDKMETDGIKLARRQSGGGAVFHDLGNTNFTFMSGKNDYDKNRNNRIITNALKRFQIAATPSGRNDILVNEKKISGSAFKETKDRAFHHGTLLIKADLQKLSNYLNPNPKKLESKGIQSVRARVENLSTMNSQINHHTLSEAIIEEFFNEYGHRTEIEKLNDQQLKAIPALNKYYEELKDWNWRFGETPHFSQRMDEKFSWGYIDVHLNAEKGLITDIKVFSDSLHPEMIEQLNLNLKKCAYSVEGINQAIAKTKVELPMIADYLDDFSSWFKTQIK